MVFSSLAMSESPTSLLPQVAAGESSAVAACLDRYGKLVWSLALRFTMDRSEAEDAVQEIFIDLWSSAGRFDPAKAAEPTFVAMIARRRLIDRLRKRRAEPATRNLEVVPEPGGEDPGLDVATKSEAERAYRIIRTLKPEQQQVIELAVYHGQTHRSIAEQLELPLGTVKTHIRRGLAKVREAMRATGGEALP